MTAAPPRVIGLLLAAGEGSRLGGPKALIRGADGTPWAARAVRVLADGGAETVYVVVGAAAQDVRAALPDEVRVIEADDWREGMGASLRAGLRAVAAREFSATAVLVLLVDTPGVGPDVVRRIAAHAAPEAIVRATYGGSPGHPVLFGRRHWAAVIQSARGDRGARDYIARSESTDIEVGDTADGADIDTPIALAEWRDRQRVDE